MQTEPLYSDDSGPLTGLIFYGHNIDPEGEAVRGQILNDCIRCFSGSSALDTRRKDCIAIINKMLESMEVENRYFRMACYMYDDEGEELPTVYFPLNGKVPNELDGLEESFRYTYCSASDEHAEAVTVMSWGEEAADEAEGKINEIRNEEFRKIRQTKPAHKEKGGE